MEEIQLDVQIRKEVGSQGANRVRRSDFIPGVVYGLKKAPTSIKVDRRAFEHIQRTHTGDAVFHINVFEGEKKLRHYSALVKEEQHDPVSEEVLHVDFVRISLKEKQTFHVPVELEGEAVGVKRDGGTLEHGVWELEVECLPTDMPEKISVSVSALEIGDAIHVKDLTLPAGVDCRQDPETIVVSVSAPGKMEEEAPAEGEEEAEPEVIKEKKKEESAEAEKEEGEEASSSE